MATTPKPRIRRSILELQNDYDKGINDDLEKLVTAWAYIKALKPADFYSFFVIGGYHGEPFHGTGATDPQWWGGYCNHSNVLFPTWHRVYMLRLEDALRTAPGCEDVTMAYWDETDPYSLAYGIPRCLTDESFTYRNGKTIPNPLASFKLPAAIDDTVKGDQGDYSKSKGYVTKRYPLSGLDGPLDQQTTYQHNAMFPDWNTNVAILNANVLQWLNNQVYYVPDANYPGPTPQASPAGVAQAFLDCLDAPTYTLFSNVQSANAYNQKNPKKPPVVPLEQPHNDIHLSVGGVNLPAAYNGGGPANDFSQILGANGDMGENDTAALDPIFYFHHCNIDRVFWLWQVKNGFKDKFDIDPKDPGATNAFNGGNGQGPAYGQTLNEPLTMQTDLKPFIKTGKTYYKSVDCINIEKQMGYTYSQGSLYTMPGGKATTKTAKAVKEDKKKATSPKLHISGINKARIKGSFIIAAYATLGDNKYLVGYHSILSRWKVGGCANCLTHLEAGGTISLHRLSAKAIKNAKFHIEIHGREDQNLGSFAEFRAAKNAANKPYTLEIK